MLGLVNAIGAADATREVASAKKADDKQYGIQVPIPLAQREAKAETPKAALPIEHEENERFEGARPHPDQAHQAAESQDAADTARAGGQHVDLYA